MKKKFPEIIKKVGFNFNWDNEKVWKVVAPVTEMAIEELEWHFDVPFLDHRGGRYNLTSRDIIQNPKEHAGEYERTMNTDLMYPIDIMENNGKFLILDGLHRLMKAYIQKMKTVNVRIIPREKISEITR